MKRPIIVLVPTVLFLLVAGSPFLNLRMANGDVDMLPPRLESRQRYDRLIADFPGLAAYIARGETRPAHRKAMADHMAKRVPLATIKPVAVKRRVGNLITEIYRFE